MRLGKETQGRDRPIKDILSSEADKLKVFEKIEDLRRYDDAGEKQLLRNRCCTETETNGKHYTRRWNDGRMKKKNI